MTPANSPVLFPVPAGSTELRFTAAGRAGYGTFPYPHGPANGVGAVTSLVNSLIGVFLGGTNDLSTYPPALNFSSSSEYVTLAPEVGQPFFIGDGEGASGLRDRPIR